MTTSEPADPVPSGIQDVKDTETADEKPDTADYDSESAEPDDDTAAAPSEPKSVKRLNTKRILAFGLLPGLALILAGGAGYLKWQGDSVRDSGPAGAQALQAATESTIALLSYHPDTADKELTAARDRLTAPFRDDYTKLITDVVIPGAKQKQISAIATVPAAASMSASQNHAVVLLFVDQSIVVGTQAPSSTASTVRVTLEKDGDRWLISQFEPV
jgi:Mce-associated membrane protein